MKNVMLMLFMLFIITKCQYQGKNPNDYRVNHNLPEDSSEYVKNLEEIKLKCLDIDMEKIIEMSVEQRIKAFQNSNCPPIVLLPGFLGTKLEFKMKNCHEFQTFHPNIMKSCGWDNCHAPQLKRFLVWANIDVDIFKMFSAEKEQHIPKLIRSVKISDNNVIKIPFRRGCMGNLLRVYYKRHENNPENEGINYQAENLKGAEIKFMKSDIRKCGSDATSNLLGDTYSFSREFKGFARMNEYLIHMGYYHGVSLFNQPYDFRMPMSGLINELDKTVKLAYTITKKIPILIGHSYGGLLAYKYSLLNPDLVHEVVSIGTPFLGAFAGFRQTILRDEQFKMSKDLEFMGNPITVHAEIDILSSKLMFNTWQTFHFIPKPILHDHVDKILKKIDLLEKESDYVPQTQDDKFIEYFYTIFPKASDTCKSVQAKNFTNNKICKINYQDLFNKSLINFEGEEISIRDYENLKNLFKSHTLKHMSQINQSLHHDYHIHPEEFIDTLFLHSEKEIFTFKNPKVPFTMIYSQHVDTPTKLSYINKQAKIVEEGPGDGTVNSFSQLYPGLRWLFENYSSDEENKHPIHFVEYCAEHKYKSAKHYLKNKNQYVSISCDCLEQTNLLSKETCNHVTMINDNKLMMFIGKVILNAESTVKKIEEFKDLYETKFTRKLICSNLDLS